LTFVQSPPRLFTGFLQGFWWTGPREKIVQTGAFPTVSDVI